jgi:2-polyprenyl-6-methoxyphenol hydroxylase-like FAD-dependent oxidoreductase
MKEVNVPVLIVGGAGCGLSLSIFLARQGIESWLVERHPEDLAGTKGALPQSADHGDPARGRHCRRRL